MNPTVRAYFKKHTGMVVIWCLITACVSFLAPLKTFQLKWLIDSQSKREAFGYLGLVFIITFLSYAFETLSRRSFTKIACSAAQSVRERVMSQVLRRPVAQYDLEGDASYLSLLTTDIRTLYDDYYMSIFNIVFWGGIMSVSLAMYLYISPVMLIAVLLVTVPPLVIPRIMDNGLKRSRDSFSLQMVQYTQSIKELLGGFELIRGFLREDAYTEQHHKASQQAKDKELQFQQSLNKVITSTSLISNMIFPIILLIGLVLVFDGKITVGTMSTAASLSNFVITPCHQIAQNYAKIKSSKGIRERLENAMADSQTEVKGSVLDPIQTISCDNLGFTYPGATSPVLHDMALSISNHEKIAIVGESGCGKSTFAKLLFQYYPNYSGHILFNGIELRDISRTALYNRVGYISQSTFLFNDTLRNNIRLMADFSDEQILQAAKSAGIADWICSLPEGLDTLISENGKNLSGGQRQRIGIARLALRSYDLIIADEITASLDTETSQQVMENLLSMPCMLVAITHDTSGDFMKNFNRIVCLADGTVKHVL